MLVKEPSALLGIEDAVPATPAEISRVDQLVALVDHCTAAIEIAEATGDKFLVYMLSMTVQAARIELRPAVLRARR